MLQRTPLSVTQPNNNVLTVEVQLIPGCASDFNSGGISSFRHVSRFSTSTSICRVRVSTYETNNLLHTTLKLSNTISKQVNCQIYRSVGGVGVSSWFKCWKTM